MPSHLVIHTCSLTCFRLVQHWILDGFPRTVGQGRLLDGHLRSSATPLTLIVNLDVPDEVILSRISGMYKFQESRVIMTELSRV
jgi:adenylate kinase family enzyme